MMPWLHRRVAITLTQSGKHRKTVRYRLTIGVREFGKYFALVLFSVFFILPWVWMISTSLKNPQELAVWPPIWIPHPIRWDNYFQAFNQASSRAFS